MLNISIKLTLLTLAVYPFMLLMVQMFSNQLRDQQATAQEKLSDLSELIQEDMSGISLIKIYGQEEKLHCWICCYAKSCSLHNVFERNKKFKHNSRKREEIYFL